MKLTILPIEESSPSPVVQKICFDDLPLGTAFRYNDSSEFKSKPYGDDGFYIKPSSSVFDMGESVKSTEINENYSLAIKITPSGSVSFVQFHRKNKWFFFEVEMKALHVGRYPINTVFS